MEAPKACYLLCFSNISGKLNVQVWARPLDGFGRALGSVLGGFLVTLVDLLELWGGRWEALGALWVALGSCWRALGRFWDDLGSFGVTLGGFWEL